MNSAIRIDRVSKTFAGTTAVDGLSLEVKAGERVVLLGTSGCGKTTTLKMVNRLIEPTTGTISVHGKDIRNQNPDELRRGIGYVLQRNSLFPHYTVAENIAVVPKLLRWDAATTRWETAAVIRRLHLSEQQLDLYPHQLSGGEAQRVNLARALISDPPILLMDEPFSALDTITRSAIRRDFLELENLQQKTILLVTHDVAEAFALADRICLMSGGKVMQLGTPKELLFHPANDFVRAFLSDAYVQLSFMVTPVDDVWNQLDEVRATADAAVVSSRMSVWSALELIRDKNDLQSILHIRREATGEIKRASWPALVRAAGSTQSSRL